MRLLDVALSPLTVIIDVAEEQFVDSSDGSEEAEC